VHARRIRPDAGPLDRRRLAAAGLSAVLPGLGQLFNGRRRLAAALLIPSLILLGIALMLILTQSPARLAAWIADPSVLGTVLTLNLVVLALRLFATAQAFLDTRWHGPTGRTGVIGLGLILVLVALPHGVAYRYGTALGDTFAKVFAGATLGSVSGDDGRPTDEGRINVLLVGVDSLPWRTTTLTDGLMVVSVDPVGSTVSIVSLPRDLIGVPLGNGDDFGPKINALMSYADRHPKAFPDGGMSALQAAVGTLLGIDIPYYARIDFFGFIDIVDAVGGVDVTVDKAFDDPEYKVFENPGPGWSISAGQHHLDGSNALAYARARKGLGESDFSRASRQQQILLALRDEVTKDGSLLWELPHLLELVGDTISTNVPVGRLPEMAAIVDEIGDDAVVRAVIRHPLVKSKSTKYGSSLVPNLKAIRRVAADLFPAPGVPPIPWPTPEPTKGPGASPSS
jgi:LCP family protein required for cell wall assembly